MSTTTISASNLNTLRKQALAAGWDLRARPVGIQFKFADARFLVCTRESTTSTFSHAYVVDAEGQLGARFGSFAELVEAMNVAAR